MDLIRNAMTNKIVLLTGGTSGVGKATALGIARTGAKLIIISRSAEQAQTALLEIAQKTGNDQGDYLVADLASQASIRQLANQFRQKYAHLNVLANLAGGLFYEKQLTTDGIERSFAVNYLGHFLLTHQLLDILQASAPARVLTVGGNPFFIKNAKINFNDLQSLHSFSAMTAAGQAMFARVFFAFELARRLQSTHVTSVAFNPGIIKSNLTANGPWYMKLLAAVYRPFEQEVCRVGSFLATDPSVEKTTGVFFNEKEQIVPFHQRFDPTIGERLWAESEALIDKHP